MLWTAVSSEGNNGVMAYSPQHLGDSSHLECDTHGRCITSLERNTKSFLQ